MIERFTILYMSMFWTQRHLNVRYTVFTKLRSPVDVSVWTCADSLIDSKHVHSSQTTLQTPHTSWPRTPLHLLPSTPGFHQARLYHSNCSNSDPSPRPSNSEDTSTSSPSLPTTSDPDLPHLTPSQTVHMTQITSKPETKRLATAACEVTFSNPRPWELLRKGQGTHKGDVFSVARIAGIMAAKRTPDLVPLCHPGIGITGVEVSVELVEPEAPKPDDYGAMAIVASVSCFGRTGVEMEAMTAACGAALTVYDMLKAVDKGMVLGGVRLLEKQGGKSGHWRREGG